MSTPVTAAVAGSGTAGVASMFFSLGLVIALIFALAYVVRRMQNLRGIRRGSLQLIGGLAVGSKERVVLVQLGDQQYLLGVAPGSVNLLQRIEASDIPAAPQAETMPMSAFAERLRELLGRKL